MSIPSSVALSEGTGTKNIATFSLSEGGLVKEVPRLAPQSPEGLSRNSEFNILPGVVGRSSSYTGANFANNYSASGLLVYVKLSNLSGGSPTFFPRFQFITFSGNIITVWTGSTLNANGDYVYLLGREEDGTISSQITSAKLIGIPFGWRFGMVYGGTGSFDVLVDGCYLFG